MLILSRNVNQTIMISDDITITILGVRGNQVRLGIEASKDIPVHREEIYLKVVEERNKNENNKIQQQNYNKE